MGGRAYRFRRLAAGSAPGTLSSAVGEPPEFRIQRSELFPDDGDELAEFPDWYLPSYVGAASFQKLPWPLTRPR